jgi:hypothetical protein
MPYNNLLGALTPVQRQAIIDAINAVKVLLEPWVVNLSIDERSRLYKMSQQRYQLGAKAINVALTKPELVPPYVNVSEGRNDYQSFNDMQDIEFMLKEMLEGVQDARMARGSETLTQFVRPLYNSIKGARDQAVPGADSAYQELFPFFDLPEQPDGGEPEPTPEP